MALLSERDRQTVAARLANLTHPVTLLFFTQTIGEPDTAPITRQILEEVAHLNDQISVEEVNFVLDQSRAVTYGITAIPAIAVLRGDQDTRIRFLGAPAGYEFMAFLEAILLAGSDDSGLTEESKALVARQVSGPIDIQVFVTPT